MRSQVKYPKQSAIPVVILAGGHGTRMGGGDKCLLDLGGRCILERLIENFSRQSTYVFLNANGNPARFSQYSIELVHDEPNDNQEIGRGPLAGILAALAHLREHNARAAWLASVAGDCPFLPVDLITRLHQHAGERTDVVYCHHGGRDHFVIALWSRSVETQLRLFLQSGKRSVGQFIGGLRHQTLIFETSDYDPFMNINTPAQLERAQTLAETLCDD